MTAEKSIKILKAVKELKDDAIYTLTDLTEAYKMAIEALSRQNESSEQVDNDIKFPTIYCCRGYDCIKDENGRMGFGVYDPKEKNIYIAGDVPKEIFLKALFHEIFHWVQDVAGVKFNEDDANSFSDILYDAVDVFDDHGPELFGQKTIVEPGEVFVGESVLKEALDQSADSDKMVDQFCDTTKKTEDNEGPKLFLMKGTPNQCGDGTEMINLKKRTIIERLTIANSLIDSVIADSDNDQFRDTTKKTEDVADTNVGNTIFKPGDKFILALGQERKMFGEFEIAGTDLYVKTSLLEKLKRYEPEVKTEKIPYKKPEIIVTMDMAKGADMVPVTRCKDCKNSVDAYNEGDCYCRRPQKALEYVGDWNFFCGAADRKEK